MFWGTTESNGVITPTKTFFSSLGTKLKSFVVEEQKSIKQFIGDNDLKSKPISPTPILIPPWEDFPEQTDPTVIADVKSQILGLTKSKRNFLNAPEDENFPFDFDKTLPLALLCLKADPVLSKARFYLVPKFIREPQFWRNYFYRVYLIKESYGVNNIHSTSTAHIPNTASIESISETTLKSASISNETSMSINREESVEFASDDYEINDNNNNNETTSSSTAAADWEAELRKELGSDLKGEVTLDEDWEEKMKKELEEEFN